MGEIDHSHKFLFLVLYNFYFFRHFLCTILFSFFFIIKHTLWNNTITTPDHPARHKTQGQTNTQNPSFPQSIRLYPHPQPPPLPHILPCLFLLFLRYWCCQPMLTLPATTTPPIDQSTSHSQLLRMRGLLSCLVSHRQPFSNKHHHPPTCQMREDSHQPKNYHTKDE